MKNKIFFVLIILSLFSSYRILAQEEPSAIEPEEATETQSKINQGPLPTLPAAAPLAETSVTKSPGQNKISLDIKGMDIVDVLKMLATRSGMNIVIGKNVTGRVTLFLKDVNVNDAFEILLLANDLAYEKKGEIINVMTQRDYELLYGGRFQDKKQAKVIPLKYAKAADLSRALNQIKTNIGRIVVDEGSNTLVLIDTPATLKEMEDFIKNTDLPVQTKVFNLNYAQADKLQTKLQEIITKGVGSIKIDERTNKIAVIDYPAKLDEIANIISAFDEKTPQVLIDSQIIELTPSDKLEVGVNFDYIIKKYFEIKANLPVSTDNTLFFGTQSASPSRVGQYKALVDALRTIGDTKILSSPRIMVLNNQEAKILVGTKEAYITSATSQGGTGTAVTSQTVNFVDVGIKLYVTPTINRDGYVTMKIRPEISSSLRTSITSENTVTQIPIVSTSEAETTVMVKDGVTIIIGGLKKDKREKTVKKIPLVGDIPLLGLLFRSTSDNVTKTELIILLTPHIMSGNVAYTDFSEIKPKDGAIARMVKGNIVTERIVGSQEKESYSSAGYYKEVTSRVMALASFDKPKSEKGEVKLAFTLSRDGNLVEEPYVIEASNMALIPFAKQAIKSASPFPRFPASLEKDRETFKINLAYE